MPGGRPDVIIVAYQYALDPYIEDPLTLRLEVDLSKIQCDVIQAIGDVEPVAELAVPRRLVERVVYGAVDGIMGVERSTPYIAPAASGVRLVGTPTMACAVGIATATGIDPCE